MARSGLGHLEPVCRTRRTNAKSSYQGSALVLWIEYVNLIFEKLFSVILENFGAVQFAKYAAFSYPKRHALCILKYEHHPRLIAQ